MYAYENIKLLLAGAAELYDRGELTTEMYAKVIENIEEYFLSVQKKIQNETAKEILDSYIATLR